MLLNLDTAETARMAKHVILFLVANPHGTIVRESRSTYDGTTRLLRSKLGHRCDVVNQSVRGLQPRPCNLHPLDHVRCRKMPIQRDSVAPALDEDEATDLLGVLVAAVLFASILGARGRNDGIAVPTSRRQWVAKHARQSPST